MQKFLTYVLLASLALSASNEAQAMIEAGVGFSSVHSGRQVPALSLSWGT